MSYGEYCKHCRHYKDHHDPDSGMCVIWQLGHGGEQMKEPCFCPGYEAQPGTEEIQSLFVNDGFEALTPRFLDLFGRNGGQLDSQLGEMRGLRNERIEKLIRMEPHEVQMELCPKCGNYGVVERNAGIYRFCLKCDWKESKI